MAIEAYTVQRIKHDLLSVNRLAAEKYISVFSGDKLSIYDLMNTKVTVSRQSVLKGWHSKNEGSWCIPLVSKPDNDNTETVIVKCSFLELFGNSVQPSTKHILSAY